MAKNVQDVMASWAAGIVLGATASIAVAINIMAGTAQDLGQDENIIGTGFLLAGLGVIGIIGEIASPIFIRRSWVAGSVILGLCLTLTGLNELSFYGQTRSAYADHIKTATSKRQRLQTEVEELTTRLWAVRTKPTGALQAEIDRRLARRIKTRSGHQTVAMATRNCAPKNYLTSRYCSKIFELKKEMAAATNIAALERRRNAAQAELDRLKAVGNVNALSKTLAGVLAPLWTLRTEDVENYIRLVFVVSIHGLLLASSSLLFRPARNSLKPCCPDEPSITSSGWEDGGATIIPLRSTTDGRAIAEGFLRTRLPSQPGSKVDFSDIYAAYGAECRLRGAEPLSANSLGIMLTALRRHSGKTRGGPNGGARYHGIRLMTHETHNASRSMAA